MLHLRYHNNFTASDALSDPTLTWSARILTGMRDQVIRPGSAGLVYDYDPETGFIIPSRDVSFANRASGAFGDRRW